jgi:hypothetical protein
MYYLRKITQTIFSLVIFTIAFHVFENYNLYIKFYYIQNSLYLKSSCNLEFFEI